MLTVDEITDGTQAVADSVAVELDCRSCAGLVELGETEKDACEVDIAVELTMLELDVDDCQLVADPAAIELTL